MSTSTFQVETSCRRVTAADIASVTPGDIEQVVAHMTDEQFKAALRVLADHNKAGVVLNSVQPEAMREALSSVTGKMVREARAKTQSSATFQALLLAYSTEQLREASAVAVEHLKQAGDIFTS